MPVTIRRILSRYALKPWQHQSWIFTYTPNDFISFDQVEDRLLAFERRYGHQLAVMNPAA